MNLSASRKTALLGALALLALTLIAWNVVLAPRLGRPAAIQAQAEQVREQNARLTASIQRLETKKDNLSQQQRYAAALAARAPADAAQAELFAAVHDAATKSGIPEQNVESVTPSVPQAVGDASGAVGVNQNSADANLASMELDITVNGSYDSIVSFLGALENMPRAYLISTVNVSPTVDAHGTAAYTLVVNGKLFVMRAPTDPTSGTK